MENDKTNPDNLRAVTRNIASVVLVSSDGKILLGRKDPEAGGVYPDVWHIPGGGVEDGESLRNAAVREAFEEVGVRLSPQQLRELPTGSGQTVKTLETEEKVWCIMTFHRYEAVLDLPATSVKTAASDDLIELTWFSKDQLGQIDLVPGGREFFIECGYITNLGQNI